MIRIWYLLVNDRGDLAFEDIGTQVVTVRTVSSEAKIAHFTKKVWEENQGIIEGVAAQLKAFSIKNDIADPKKVLKAGALLGDQGGSEDTPLFVVVPNLKIISPRTPSEGAIERILSVISESVRECFAESKVLEVSMSRASSNFRRSMFRTLNLLSEDVEIPELPQFTENGHGCTPFLWDASKHGSTENKNAYLSFISSNFGNFPRLRVYDGNHEDSNLRTSLNGIALNGNVDCLISSTDAPERAVDTSHLLFVLRKPIDSDMKVTETELKLLAADVTSSYPVLAVVSDLNDSWKILWIQSKHDGRKVVSSSQYLSLNFAVGIINGYLQAVQNMLNRGDLEFEESDFVDHDYPKDGEVDADQFSTGECGLNGSQSKFKFMSVKMKEYSNQ